MWSGEPEGFALGNWAVRYLWYKCMGDESERRRLAATTGQSPQDLQALVGGRIAVRDELGVLVDELRDVLLRDYRHARR